MKVYVANNRDRNMIEIALGFGVINSLTVASAIELRDKLDDAIRATQAQTICAIHKTPYSDVYGCLECNEARS